MNRFFDTSVILTMQDLREQYHRMVKIYHPDLGGRHEDFVAMQNEYEALSNKIINGENLSEQQKQTEREISSTYRELINALVVYPQITVDLVGKWLWVGGNTYPIKDILKELGFKFASKKKLWFYRDEEYKVRSKGDLSFEEIKKKYGATRFTGKGPNAIGSVNDILTLINKLRLLVQMRKQGIGYIPKKNVPGYVRRMAAALAAGRSNGGKVVALHRWHPGKFKGMAGTDILNY